MAQSGGRNLAGKSFLNVLSAMAGYGVALAVNFFLNPVLVGALGADLFGIWKVCQRLLIYVSAADGKPTQALKWTIANQQLKDDISAKQRQIGSALVIWVRFLPIMLGAGALLMWLAPSLIRELPSPLHFVTRLTVAILLINLLIYPLRTIPEAVMIGMNLAYRTTWVNAVGVVLGGLFMAFAAVMGWGLVGMACGVLIASLLNGTLIFGLARKSLPWLAVRRASRDEVRAFFGFSLWVFASTFINKVMLSSDVVILAMVTAPATVAAYTLSFYAVQTAMQMVGMFLSAAMPGLGAVVGQQDLARAVRVRREILALTMAAAATLGAMILLWNRSFVGLWVGTEHFVGLPTNLLLVILMTQMVLIRNDGQIIDVTLKVKTKAIIGGISVGISILLAFVLGLYVLPGTSGVLLGIVAGRLILSLTYPVIVKQYLDEKGASSFPGGLRNWAYLLCLYGACYFAGGRLTISHWPALILGVAVSLAAIGLLTFLLGLNAWQRQQVRLRFNQLLGKKS